MSKWNCLLGYTIVVKSEYRDISDWCLAGEYECYLTNIYMIIFSLPCQCLSVLFFLIMISISSAYVNLKEKCV